MARVPLIEEANHPELTGVIARIKDGRRGSLINVYRLLLNSPELAQSWFTHLNAVRWKTELSGRLRELVVIRIGWLLAVPYILNQHIPKLALADGVSEAECAALQKEELTSNFNAAEKSALAFADCMTRQVHVPAEIFEPLRQFYSPQQIVELSVLVGTYNMHARVLSALEIDLEPKAS
jgi:alkylhydroperoxidase family enzyme